MTEWERSREREEFARAAQLYVSSNSTLSSRFTHAKEEDDSDQVEVPRDQEVCGHCVPMWRTSRVSAVVGVELNPGFHTCFVHGLTIRLHS